MTALDTAEALAADLCADLHGREAACLGCRRAVGEELEAALASESHRNGPRSDERGSGRVVGHLGERQDGSGR